MSEKGFVSTEYIRYEYADYYPDEPEERRSGGEEFDAWLQSVKADAWDEGFEAGERDVFEHERTSYDEPCIKNPYRSNA